VLERAGFYLADNIHTARVVWPRDRCSFLQIAAALEEVTAPWLLVAAPLLKISAPTSHPERRSEGALPK